MDPKEQIKNINAQIAERHRRIAQVHNRLAEMIGSTFEIDTEEAATAYAEELKHLVEVENTTRKEMADLADRGMAVIAKRVAQQILLNQTPNMDG